MHCWFRICEEFLMLTVQVGSGTLGFFLIRHGKPVQKTKQPWPSDKEITPQTREQGSWFFLLIHPYPCIHPQRPLDSCWVCLWLPTCRWCRDISGIHITVLSLDPIARKLTVKKQGDGVVLWRNSLVIVACYHWIVYIAGFRQVLLFVRFGIQW